jgi:hypothetical protein
MPGMGWIGLTQDRNRWRILVNVASWNLSRDVRSVGFTFLCNACTRKKTEMGLLKGEGDKKDVTSDNHSEMRT